MHTTLRDAQSPAAKSVARIDDALDLPTLLRQWAETLRDRPDPIMSPHSIDELLERVDSMDDVRRDHLAAATKAQQASLARHLETGVTPASSHDLVALRRSLGAAIEVVGTWPRGGLPPPDLIEIRHAECDLAALVRAACAAFEPLAEQRNLELVTRIPPSVAAEADPPKVQRVVLNLLFNAFKLTPVGGSIGCVLEHNQRLDEALLAITDTGPGVAVGAEESIFARHRLSDRSPGAPGVLGFDLGSSRDLTALHGGTLRTVRRAAHSGAEFHAHLPLHAPRHTPVASHAGVDKELPATVARIAAEELRAEARLGTVEPTRDDRPLVLVVEDSRLVQRMLIEALADVGTTASALDGISGLRMAAQLQPDLVVADLSLPGMDGTELVRAMRARENLVDIPILVVSGEQDAVETIDLLSEGVQDVLRKPFLIPELKARAQNLIEAKRARDVLGKLLGERQSDLGRLAADVTRHQRRLEAALDEVRLARELAESASRVKSNFLRMMSHELKTPVTALLLQQQVLRTDPLIASAPDNVQRGFRSISRSVYRLLHIVDTMLEWARVESGRCRLERQEVDLRKAVLDAVEEIRPRAEVRDTAIDVRYQSSSGHVLMSDGRIVRLITINLLERAVSVTDHGTVTVDLSCSGGLHSLRVTDGGPPLTGDERRNLFDALAAKADLTRSGGSGSGLGLQVVRDLARALGGDLALVADEAGNDVIELILDEAHAGPQPRATNNYRE